MNHPLPTPPPGPNLNPVGSLGDLYVMPAYLDRDPKYATGLYSSIKYRRILRQNVHGVSGRWVDWNGRRMDGRGSTLLTSSAFIPIVHNLG